MDESINTEQIIEKMKRLAEYRATERAQAARWDIDVAAFYFAILILVIILVYQDIEIWIVSPSAVIGLVTGWLIGRRKGKQKYYRFYDEELLKMELELKGPANRVVNVTPDERALKKRHKKKSRRKNAGNNIS